MSNLTENALKEIVAKLKSQDLENMSEEERYALIGTIIGEYNSNLPGRVTELTATTSDDYLELAEEAHDAASALRYAKKALQLDPDNLDAERMILDITVEEPLEYVQKLERVVAHGAKVMEKEGLAGEDSIGSYWGIIETRPYMRLRMAYLKALQEAGMFRRAITECEELLRLCEGDNLGVRYSLMHLYALMEEETKALQLHEKFEQSEETQLLLPLSILYFKLGNEEKSEAYLKKVVAVNKDTKKFFKGLENEDLDRYVQQMSPYGYQPFTMEELIAEVVDNPVLFSISPAYIHWVNEKLKRRKR